MSFEGHEHTRADAPGRRPSAVPSLETVREQAERAHISSVLRLTEGNRTETARLLGISRKTLWKKLKQLGVSQPLS
ncbi:MAG TPA: helix-turn-helix domain-containing protein [Candidatus Sulfotelmatobacter sp.]|nr:helix-turn-helix domain-containing protein [Candidatus Sulfotelmatobacter sp.]